MTWTNKKLLKSHCVETNEPEIWKVKIVSYHQMFARNCCQICIFVHQILDLIKLPDESVGPIGKIWRVFLSYYSSARGSTLTSSFSATCFSVVRKCRMSRTYTSPACSVYRLGISWNGSRATTYSFIVWNFLFPILIVEVRIMFLTNSEEM